MNRSILTKAKIMRMGMLESSDVQSIAAAVLESLVPKCEAPDSIVALRNELVKRFSSMQGAQYTQALLEVMRNPLRRLVDSGTITVVHVEQFYQIMICPLVGDSAVIVGQVA
jgi:hypothetical protein